MKTLKVSVFVGAALACGLSVHAQAPAGGRGGGRGGNAGPTLSIIQQLAAAKMEIPSELTAAVTSAQNDLVAASLAQPANAAALQSAAQALGRAELALAMARRAGFESVQASLEKLTPEQAASALGGGGGGRGGRGGAAAVDWKAAWEDMGGFVSLFDGKSFNGWDGETNVWMINDGSIHSDNVNNSSGQHHVHFIGLPGVSPIIKDFDLKVEFKIVGGNGGIHYRSRLLSPAHKQDNEMDLRENGTRNHFAAVLDPLGKMFPPGITTDDAADAAGLPRAGNTSRWQISGYQYDITGNNTASLYEGQGRGVVANSGESIILTPGGGRTVIAKLSDIPYQQFGRDNDWNYAEVIARGNTLIHILNGRIFMVAVDDDPERRAEQGIISLQLEGTGQIWYRQVWLKNL